MLAEVYPGSVHVRDLGLSAAEDELVWDEARTRGLAIVTKDDDFRQRSILRGFPPKVVWVRLGNCRTADVEEILRARAPRVLAFDDDPYAALLVLARAPLPARPPEQR